jgi:aspartyl-tRNA(Asn)/glutamyl-tRNA(Gln) amidotransferase subunit A
MKGDFTAVDLTKAYLEEIKKKNSDINAYLEVFEDAVVQAQKADVLIQQAQNNMEIGAKSTTQIGTKNTQRVGLRLSPLIGVPFAIKDNILINGRRAGSASKILEGYIAPYDATVIRKLKESGAVFLGRTNMDEFAMGGSNENSAYGPVRNPHDQSRVSGGSSGGSAASVAVPGDGNGMALAALGSDTGGSVRQPASFCGVVGLKPTYGRISRYGVMAMGSSLDQIGPLGKTVGDVEIIFDALKGHDTMDSTTLPDGAQRDIVQAKSLKSPTTHTTKKMTIGIPRHLLKEGVDPEVLANYEKAIERFKALGYTIKDIFLPNSSYALAVYYVLMPAEAASNLARFDGVKYGLHKDGSNLIDDYIQTRTAGFGREVRRRIFLGNYILSAGYYDAYYNKANFVRNLIRDDYEKAFESVDLVLTPTSPLPAFKIGEKLADPLQMYLADIFTVTANLTRMPAISVPSGTLVREGKSLPLGIQLTAPDCREDSLFTAGKDFLGETR